MSIKPERVIELGDSLLGQHRNTFSDDFETNKENVQQLTEVESQKVRNRVAGYITRKLRQ
ncbi:30S ribosomal protein S17e [Halodesulfurarchaeum sp.]|uniref:30S ribosomal protein S17e n=1 Tax=Halodesulfurarchaeum sp. TaxID=1980530 RepID=UPI002FC2A592